MLNIWLIQIGEPLPLSEGKKKLRTALLADELIARGHSVLWWTSAFDHLSKEWLFSKDTKIAVNGSLSILALKGTGYKKNISISRFIDHRAIVRKFREAIPKEARPDIIVASMPSHDLACEAVKFASKNGIPVIVDIRDPWPDIFIENVPWWIRKAATAVLAGDFRMVRDCMRMADSITAVTNGFLEWGLACAGRKATRRDGVFYLGCQKSPKDPGRPIGSKLSETLEILKGKFVVTFMGTFARYHDPSAAVDCARKLLGKGIHFVFAGDGELSGKLKAMSSGLTNVSFPGWLSQGEIDILLRHSHVGLCTTPRAVGLFPNKAFTYFAAGLPVISAFSGDLKYIIDEYGVGLNYPPGDADKLLECVRVLYDDASLYGRMSAVVKDKFERGFDADRIYTAYADHIERVVHEHKP